MKFRQWVESPDPTILGRLNAESGSNTRKKGSKVEDKKFFSNNDIEEPLSDQITNHPQEQEESLDYNQEIKQTFFEKHVIDLLLMCFTIIYRKILRLLDQLCM